MTLVTLTQIALHAFLQCLEWPLVPNLKPLVIPVAFAHKKQQKNTMCFLPLNGTIIFLGTAFLTPIVFNNNSLWPNEN